MDKSFIIWLAGLISTDGNVQQHYSHKYGLSARFRVDTTEKEWYDLIIKRFEENGLKHTVFKPFMTNRNLDNKNYQSEVFAVGVSIKNTRKLIPIFIKYGAEKYFNPRKWNLLLEGYQKRTDSHYEQDFL